MSGDYIWRNSNICCPYWLEGICEFLSLVEISSVAVAEEGL